MRKCLLLMFCAAAFMPRSVLAVAASQAWVSNYVERAIASSKSEAILDVSSKDTNGIVMLSYGDAVLRYEKPSDAALLATNCTAMAEARGVTNGCVFVWNGTGAYVNPSGVISCTSTNLVFSGVGSVLADDLERFAGWFDAYGVLIQPHTSFAVTNGMTEVTR